MNWTEQIKTKDYLSQSTRITSKFYELVGIQDWSANRSIDRNRSWVRPNESIQNRSWTDRTDWNGRQVQLNELIGTENQPIKNESEQKICRSKWIDRKREKSVWPNESIDQEKSRSWVRPNESKRDPPKAFLAGLSYFISFATTFLNEKLGFQSLYCTQQRNIRVSVYRVTPVAASCSTHACKLPRLPCVDSVSKRYFYI